MTSWSNRPDALVRLAAAQAEHDRLKVFALLSEKHGERYAADVLAELRRDIARIQTKGS